MTAGGVISFWGRLSLSTRILIGLGLGILTGLFLGELARPLQVLSEAYIRLMQMTVIPYMAVAIIVGLGQLSLEQAKLLAARGMVILLTFWAIAFLVLYVMPLSFPELQAASFFSTTLIEPKRTFDFVGLYIPSNPFHALANNVVPAVVFFSATVGVALIGVEDKVHLMSTLQAFLDGLTRVAKFIVNLTPFGVFAIGAVMAGTMEIEELARVPVYLVSFTVAALLLTFWMVPGLISAVTPFRYRDVLAVSRDAMLTAFVTHSLFIVVPILIDHQRRILENYRLQDEDSDKLAKIIIPVTYNFPTAGKLLTLLFVPFTAWMAGSALEQTDFPRLFLIGLASYFAKAQTALPFLMDQFEIPQDLFDLYIPTSIITGKFDTLVSAMNLLAFSLIGTASLAGYLVLKPARILRYLGISALGLLLAVSGTGVLLRTVIDTGFSGGQGLMQMRLMGGAVPTKVYRADPGDLPGSGRGKAMTVRAIKERGVLRVGYVADRYPFTFFNEMGELVGFDVEVTSQLAADLGVRLEFIPVLWNELRKKLESGSIDMVPGVPYLSNLLEVVEYSDPVLTVTAGFVVRDHHRHEFATLESLEKHRKLTIGVPANPEIIEKQLRAWLPGVEIELVELKSHEEFFKAGGQEIDALLTSAEIGTAFTLLHPEYAVVVPQPTLWRVPQGFATAMGDFEVSEYLDGWVATHKQIGTFQRAYNYWILGEGANQKQPRWSIIRNVLHWID